MNKVLSDNIIIFYFCHYCSKSKKLGCQEEILIIKIKEQEEKVNVEDDEENCMKK